MHRIRVGFGLLATALFVAVAAAQDQAGKAQTVRPEVGQPLQSAVEFLKTKRGREALAKAREAQAVPNKTPYEAYLTTRVFAQAAAAAGDARAAAEAFESAAGSAAAPEAESRQFLAAAVGQYYTVKDYAKAAEVADRYFKQGGTDKSVHTLHVQSLYLGNNFAAAAKAVAADIEAEEKAGKTPAEDQIQLLANACLQSRDTAGYGKAMEKLLLYHPKRDYWLNVLYDITTRPGFSERLVLDVTRLKIETGTMRTANEYLDGAQLSLLDGLPIEATKILDRGFAAGLLGVGPEAERHKRLKDLAAKNLAEDIKGMTREPPEATSAKDGAALFNDGFNLVLHGKSEQGLELMQEGMRMGIGARRPDHLKLRLAYAYHLAGQNDKALQQFKAVQGSDGASALARLWIIRLSRAS